MTPGTPDLAKALRNMMSSGKCFSILLYDDGRKIKNNDLVDPKDPNKIKWAAWFVRTARWMVENGLVCCYCKCWCVMYRGDGITPGVGVNGHVTDDARGGYTCSTVVEGTSGETREERSARKKVNNAYIRQRRQTMRGRFPTLERITGVVGKNTAAQDHEIFDMLMRRDHERAKAKEVRKRAEEKKKQREERAREEEEKKKQREEKKKQVREECAREEEEKKKQPRKQREEKKKEKKVIHEIKKCEIAGCLYKTSNKYTMKRHLLNIHKLKQHEEKKKQREEYLLYIKKKSMNVS